MTTRSCGVGDSATNGEGIGDGRMTIFGTERTFFVVMPLMPPGRASPDGGRRDDDDGSASCSLVLRALVLSRSGTESLEDSLPSVLRALVLSRSGTESLEDSLPSVLRATSATRCRHMLQVST